MIAFVLDASVALTWCLEDQATAYSESVFAAMEAGARVQVPFIWPLEVANVLATVERRGGLTAAQIAALVEGLASWPIAVDPLGLPRAMHQILALARATRLTAYDAAYLELAARIGLPLASLDQKLNRAAEAHGVALFTP